MWVLVLMDGMMYTIGFRGTNFDQVIKHLFSLNEYPFVKSLTIDFTLSAFNCFQLPEFLENIVKLRKQVNKISECPVFQWVQQPYGSPLNLKLKDGEEIFVDANLFFLAKESCF